MTDPVSPVAQTLDPAVVYQEAYDSLADAYWDASDVNSKDLIYGAQQAIGQIIRAIDQQQLADNTAVFLQLAPKIKAINARLATIQAEIHTITKNLNTAGTVIAAINKVISLFPL